MRILKNLSKTKNKLSPSFNLVKTVPLVFLNTATHGMCFWVIGFPALALPAKSILRNRIDEFNVRMANSWISTNNTIIDNLLPRIDWQVSLPPQVSEHKKYLLICNHQSWVDTMVMQYVGLKKLPFTRFFTKYELIYVPFAGQAFKILGFPMMKRHTKKALLKKPELRMQDFEEAQKSCESMKQYPFTLLNYLEGTRFTKSKHEQQNSPYQNLLKPKYSGFALATQILANKVDGVLDMTIIYPDGIPSYMDIWKGNLTKVIVNIEELTLPSWINTGVYQHDEDYKEKFRAWVDGIWKKKDHYIAEQMQLLKKQMK